MKQDVVGVHHVDICYSFCCSFILTCPGDGDAEAGARIKKLEATIKHARTVELKFELDVNIIVNHHP